MSDGRLAINRIDDIYVIDFMETRIVDQMAINQINQELTDLATKAGMPKFVLNFGSVTHISSAMIGVLMTLHKACKKEGGNMRLAGINGNIMEVFKLCRLDKMMQIYPNTDAAMIKFK